MGWVCGCVCARAHPHVHTWLESVPVYTSFLRLGISLSIDIASLKAGRLEQGRYEGLSPASPALGDGGDYHMQL